MYNGWRYVGSPAIGYLEKVTPSSRTYGLRSNLLLKVCGFRGVKCVSYTVGFAGFSGVVRPVFPPTVGGSAPVGVCDILEESHHS